MPLTERQLNRTTLERQLLRARARASVPEVLAQVLALQAQEPASPYLALWNRVEGFRAGELDRAFAGGEVVKASLMRITLHAVRADDYPLLHAAMRPSLRASRLFDRRFRDSGLTIDEVDGHEPALLAGSTAPHSGAEMIERLRVPFGERAERAWWAYRTYAAFHHAPTGGPWSFGPRPSFRAAPQTLPAERHTASVDGLVTRYLRAFGPATVPDIAQFTLLTRAVARAALERLGERVVRLDGPAGCGELFDLPGLAVASEGPVPPRLLPMWDSVLLAYADRRRVIPERYRAHVIRRNGDVLPTLLVDGHVAGAWRFREGRIEAAAFEPLAPADWSGLEDEAGALAPLIAERDALLYGRHRRWWDQLPAVETRLLAEHDPRPGEATARP